MNPRSLHGIRHARSGLIPSPHRLNDRVHQVNAHNVLMAVVVSVRHEVLNRDSGPGPAKRVQE